MSVMASSLLIFHLFDSRCCAGTHLRVFLVYIRHVGYHGDLDYCKYVWICVAVGTVFWTII